MPTPHPGAWMLFEQIPAYSLAPFVGLVANGTITFLGLGAFLLNPRFKALGYLLLFQFSLCLFFLGYAIYGMQQDSASIVLWYRVMLAGLAWMPMGQLWLAREVAGPLPSRLTWLITLLSLGLGLAALAGQGPWFIQGGLEEFGAGEGILRPLSPRLRPAIFGFTLLFCLLLLAQAVGQLGRCAPTRRPALFLYCAGLVLWVAGGVHDALFALGWESPLGGTVLWLGSLGLSVALTMTMAVNLNQMQESIRLSRDVFKRFVPEAYLRRIAREGLGSIRLGQATSQEVTILYCDIRGFTQMASRLDPAQLVGFMNRYLERMTQLVDQAQGVIDKFIGDAILCIFEGERAGARALDCAQGMLAAAALMRDPDGEPLRVGLGLHAGPVVLGTVGSSQRMDSTVMGLAVNIASRLEQATKTLGLDLLVSGQVVASLPGDRTWPLRLLGDFLLRGGAEAVEVWECFCQDPPPLAGLKAQAAALTMETRRLWRAGQTEQAGQMLAQARALLPQDKALARLEQAWAAASGQAQRGAPLVADLRD